MDTREILVGARKLLEDPAKWIKGDYERNGCYCLMGALQTVGFERGAESDQYDAAVAALQAAVRQRIGLAHSVVLFNDRDLTTHTDVLSVLDSAIASIPAEAA